VTPATRRPSTEDRIYNTGALAQSLPQPEDDQHHSRGTLTQGHGGALVNVSSTVGLGGLPVASPHSASSTACWV
jgi:hypothetical protein